MAPKQAIRFKEAFLITTINFDVDAVSKNGIPFTVGVEVNNDWFELIDYAIYRDDAEPISGRIGIHVVDISKQSLKDYINSYNEKAIECYDEKVRNLIQHISYCLKLELAGKITLKNIQLVVYDESQVKRHPKRVDRVPYEALTYYYGLEDVKGSIYISEINW